MIGNARTQHLMWSPFEERGLASHECAKIEARIGSVLRSWKRTPYMAGQCVKGVAVDCVRFFCAVYDELYGFRRMPALEVPSDVSLHNRKAAIGAMRLLRRVYSPAMRVRDLVVEPGDAIVTGPPGPRGGPGHVLIAGDRNSLWEASNHGVHETGIRVVSLIFGIYRAADRWRWAYV